MLGAALIFLVVFLLNVIPAFAPPTWMVVSFIDFRYPAFNVSIVVFVGAFAATLGRILLAKLSHTVIRQRMMGPHTRDNVDAIRNRLEGNRKLTFGICLFYAFAPLPSNYLFIAYGLTGLNLSLVAVPFFIGRCISYSIWGMLSTAVLRIFLPHPGNLSFLFSSTFIASQFAILGLVYLFAKIDWRLLFEQKKLRWVSHKAAELPRP